MSRFNLVAFALFGFVWAGYSAWSSGYQAGYDDGNEEAWTTARATFMPQESDQVSLVLTDSEPSTPDPQTAQSKLETKPTF